MASDPNARCRAWYARNREAQVKRVRNWQLANPELNKAAHAAAHERKAAFLRAQKVGKSCTDCGFGCTENNYVAFDWDHLPGVVKLFAISQAFRRARTNDQVLAEIAKCELRCRNCHAIKTMQRLAEGSTSDH